MELYHTVRITGENYTQKFDPASPYRFSRRGGIFEVPETARINSEEARGRSHFYYRSDTNGISGSMLWVSKEDPDMAPLKAQVERIAAGTEPLYMPGYIVCGRGASRIGLSLLCEAFEAALEKQIAYAFLEVYRVLGYTDDQGRSHDLLMDNESSLRIVMEMDGFHIADNHEKTMRIAASEATARALPRAYAVPIARALPRLKALIAIEDTVNA
ncbi:MAG: hypothetical protein LBR44_00990 [Clostridiales Family XIII bacterium]|nr:hypothetical protein [Clostridiales Family XIII bacterium]